MGSTSVRVVVKDASPPAPPARGRVLRALLAGAVLSGVAVLAPPAPAGAQAGGLTVTRPPAVGVPMAATSVNLRAARYVEAERFVSGTATLYDKAAGSTWGSDGRWSVTPSGSTPFSTRVLVRMPSDPRRFNGTVVVEWLNVTNGFDVDVNFLMGHKELLRSGVAYVGVSAQVAGVNYLKNGSPPLLTYPNTARYASLTPWTNDGASYDIFTQVARAVRERPEEILGRGFRPSMVVASGHSQSAGRLVTYYNAVQPVSQAFDGFLIHGRSGGAAPLQNAIPAPAAGTTPPPGTPPTIAALPANQPARLRTDGPKVMVLQAETDSPGMVFARQADSDTYRLWEVAGSAHGDRFFLAQGARGQQRDVVGFPAISCGKPFNDFPFRFVMHSAYAALQAWVADGIPPFVSPPIDVDFAKAAAATTGLQRAAAVNRDADGNAKGGIRLPFIDAPYARYEAFGAGGLCDSVALFGLLGGQQDWTVEELRAKYGSVAAYRAQFDASLGFALYATWLHPLDVAEARSLVRSVRF